MYERYNGIPTPVMWLVMIILILVFKVASWLGYEIRFPELTDDEVISLVKKMKDEGKSEKMTSICVTWRGANISQSGLIHEVYNNPEKFGTAAEGGADGKGGGDGQK